MERWLWPAFVPIETGKNTWRGIALWVLKLFLLFSNLFFGWSCVTCSTLEKVERSSAPRSAKEGGLLLDRTANHFFLFCQRKGFLVWNVFLQNSFWKTSLLLCLIVSIYIMYGKLIWSILFCFVLRHIPVRFAWPFGCGWRDKQASRETDARHLRPCERVHIIYWTETTPLASADCWKQGVLHIDNKPNLVFLILTKKDLTFKVFICWTHWMIVWDNQTKKSSIPGEIGRRSLKPETTHGWKELANVFEQLLGGSDATRQAARYLRQLADDQLPIHPLHPLPWHEAEAVIEIISHAREEPHPCVLAVLCPSVPLRAVWRRGRWLAFTGVYLPHCWWCQNLVGPTCPYPAQRVAKCAFEVFLANFAVVSKLEHYILTLDMLLLRWWGCVWACVSPWEPDLDGMKTCLRRLTLGWAKGQVFSFKDYIKPSDPHRFWSNATSHDQTPTDFDDLWIFKFLWGPAPQPQRLLINLSIHTPTLPIPENAKFLGGILVAT